MSQVVGMGHKFYTKKITDVSDKTKVYNWLHYQNNENQWLMLLLTKEFACKLKKFNCEVGTSENVYKILLKDRRNKLKKII